MPDVITSSKLRLKFEPYKNSKFLFFVTELNIRNTLLPFFASLGVKKLSFMKNKEELLYEIGENSFENRDNRYSIGIMTYHHENIGNPAYIASLLQSIKQIQKKHDAYIPFIVLAHSEESLEIQFGKTSKIRALSIRAAAKNGLKGLVIGKLEEQNTAEKFIEKVIEIMEDDELSKMTSVERHLRKLINNAYSFLNKMFGSAEEKEENINNAISLFEDVLDQSRDNCEALLGKALACLSSSDPEKIREGTELFAKLTVVGEDMERIYEGHAGACYKMAELVKDNNDTVARKKWLLKGVKSLDSLVAWQVKEYESIKNIQHDYHDPDLRKKLANKYSTMAGSLAELGDKHTSTAINYHLRGIEMDPKVASNYKVIQLMEENAKKHADYAQIIKTCATARDNLPGKEIDFLISEAEAHYKAGRQHDATNIYNSINEYISKKKVRSWIEYKKSGKVPNKKELEIVDEFISFLNHRAIYFRKIGNHEKSLSDLNTAISIDMDNSNYDLYFNMAKAIISSMNDGNSIGEYTLKNALTHLNNSIQISININLETYENLLKAIKTDAILNPYINDITCYLNKSNFSVPIFFK